MRKAKDIIGLPVMEIAGGKQLGTVKDIVIDSEWKVQGIVLDAKHWFSPPKTILCDHIIAFGEDAVTVPDENCVEQAEPAEDWRYLESADPKLKGLPVMTVNGNQLGVVEDVYFEEKMGKKIVGYELTDGFISDLTEGRKWLPAPDNVTFGEDALIVPLHSDGNLREIDTHFMKE